MQLHHPTILICVYYKHQMKEEVIMKKLGGESQGELFQGIW